MNIIHLKERIAISPEFAAEERDFVLDAINARADRELERGDIIQIGREHHWADCVAVVDEVRSWGVTAFVKVPMGGDAFIRIEPKDYAVVGRVKP